MDDVRELITHAKHAHQRALIAMCGMLGLRISEALSVKPEHFEILEMLLTVRGKGNVDRTIPISGEAMSVLLPIIVSTPEGRRLVPTKNRGARAYLTRLGQRVLGYDIASHDFRMTFGTAVNDKYGLRAAQELLGHARSTTTEIYTLVTMNTLRQAVEL